MSDGTLIFDTKIDNNGFKNGVSSIKSDLSKATKSISKSLTNLEKNSIGKLGNMLKMKAFHEVANVLSKNIKESFSDLTKNSAIFGATVNQLSGSFKELSNSIASALMPVIQALAPILETVISKVTDVMNVIAQLTAYIFGNGKTFMKAKSNVNDYSKSLSNASKQSKKLASFDTIEKLADAKNGSGGSETQSMFEETAIDQNLIQTIEEIKQKISDLFANIDFNGMAESFKNGFDYIMKNIVEPFVNRFEWYILPILRGVIQNASKVLEPLASFFSSAFEKIRKVVGDVMRFVGKIFDDTFLNFRLAWDKWGVPIFEALGKAITSVQSIFETFYNSIFKPIWDNLMKMLNELWDNHIQPLQSKVFDFIGTLVEAILTLWSEILAPFIEKIIKDFAPIIVTAVTTITDIVGTIVGTISDVIGGIILILQGIIDFIVGIFTKDWERAWLGIKEIFNGIFQGIVGILRGIINGIIDLINGMITAIETSLNWIIDQINSIEITNPFTGEEIWSPNLPSFNFSRVPHLATGTVIPSNTGEFMAMLGDNNKETEVVSPLSTMKQAFIEAMQETNVNGSTTVVLELNGTEFGRAVYNANKKETQRIGTSLRFGGAY